MKYFSEYVAAHEESFIDLYRDGFGRYCRKMSTYYGSINNQGLALLDDDEDSENESSSIDELFILPSFNPTSVSAESFTSELQIKSAETNVSAAQLLKKYPRQFVLGDPGIGKTTFLHWLAISLAHHRSNYVQKSIGALLPLVLRVRDFRSYLSNANTPKQFIQNIIKHLGSLGELIDIDLMKQALVNGQVLLLVDGLDEIGKEETRYLGESLAELFDKYPSVRCVMTARIVGFDASLLWPILQPDEDTNLQQDSNKLIEETSNSDDSNCEVETKDFNKKNTKLKASQLHDFSLFYIQPLDDEQRLDFSEKWCSIYVKNKDEQRKFIKDLDLAFSDNHSLGNLSRTPVLLNMICFIQLRRGRLPNGRAELYQKIIETYLVAMDRARGIENKFIDSEDFDYTDIRNWLAKLAYLMQQGKLNLYLDKKGEIEAEYISFDDSLGRDISLTNRELLLFLTNELTEVYEDRSKCESTALQLIDYIKRRTGFLIDKGQDVQSGVDTVFGFSHLSFQEYFAAHFISQQWSQISSDSDVVASLRESCRERSWFECWQLVFEDFSQNGNNRQQHKRFIDKLFNLRDKYCQNVFDELSDAFFEHNDYGVHLLSKVILNPAVKLPPEYRQNVLSQLWLYNFLLEDYTSSESMLSLWPALAADYEDINSYSRKSIEMAKSWLKEKYDDTVHSQNRLNKLDLSKIKNLDLRPIKLWPDLLQLNVRDSQLAELSELKTLRKLEGLDISNTQVTDLTPLGIELCSNLKILIAEGRTLDYHSQIDAFKSLETLWLSDTKINDLGFLEGLTELKVLGLVKAKCRDLTSLPKLSKLHNLNLHSSSLVDISKVDRCKSLKFLNINATNVQDISHLSSLTELSRLFLCNTKITDLSAVSQLIKLKGLFVNCTNITDLTPLKDLKNLEVLDIRSTDIGDLSPLLGLRSLRRVRIDNCPNLTSKSIQKFKKAAGNGVKVSGRSVIQFQR